MEMESVSCKVEPVDPDEQSNIHIEPVCKVEPADVPTDLEIEVRPDSTAMCAVVKVESVSCKVEPDVYAERHVELMCKAETEELGIPEDVEVDVQSAQSEIYAGALTPFVVEQLVTGKVLIKKLPQQLVDVLLTSTKPCKVIRVTSQHLQRKTSDFQQCTQHSDKSRLSESQKNQKVDQRTQKQCANVRHIDMANPPSGGLPQKKSLSHQYGNSVTEKKTSQDVIQTRAFTSLTEFEPHSASLNKDVCPNRVSVMESFVRDSEKSLPNTSFKCLVWTNLTANKQDRVQFKCRSCEKWFNSLSDLKIHENYHNMKRKLYKCSLCPKTYQKKDSLTLHYSTHLKKKSSKRQYHEEQLFGEQPLKIRKASHSVAKTYKCSFCQKRFVYKSKLLSHQATHASKTKLKCHICAKQFRTENQLNVHEMTHTEPKQYKCLLCDKVFDKKCDLMCHEVIHTGREPLKCTFCEKKASQKALYENS